MYCSCHNLDKLEGPPHEVVGCRGVWIYVCCQHITPLLPLPPPRVSEDSSHTPTPPDHKKKQENCWENKPTVRVYCKAKTDYSLAISQGKVILALCNSSDPYQQWIKDEGLGINVKDEQGFSSFALINKATGQAMKHSVGVKYPVQLTDYNPNKLDKSVLWSMSKNQGGGYRAIRAVDNIHLNAAAHRGGIRGGSGGSVDPPAD